MKGFATFFVLLAQLGGPLVLPLMGVMFLVSQRTLFKERLKNHPKYYNALSVIAGILISIGVVDGLYSTFTETSFVKASAQWVSQRVAAWYAPPPPSKPIAAVAPPAPIEYTRGWIGVETRPIDPPYCKVLARPGCIPNSAIVAAIETSRIFEDSPAVTSGISKLDRINSIDRHFVDSPQAFADRVVGLKPGTTITLGVYRGDTYKQIPLRVGGRTEDIAIEGLGLVVRAYRSEPDSTTSPGGEGVLPVVSIVGVDGASDASRQGLRAGDQLLSVGGQRLLHGIGSINAILARLKSTGATEVALRVHNPPSEARTVTVRLPNATVPHGLFKPRAASGTGVEQPIQRKWTDYIPGWPWWK